MPERIVCSDCGFVFYDNSTHRFPQLKSGLEIIKHYEGKCPDFGKKLKFSADAVNIYDANSEPYKNKTLTAKQDS
jgi:hypothetical protein